MRDAHGRKLDYLRISITDRCNLRCAYCMPADGVPRLPHAAVLRYEEIRRLVGLARDLGFAHFRVTGGEPLVRRGAVAFLADLARDLAGRDLALTTNGTLLAPIARRLRAASLRRVNISLDTLRPGRFAQLTRRDDWAAAWAGVEAALAAGFAPVKLNVVVVAGFNDDEVLDFARLTHKRPLHVRFIELMPLGEGCALPGGLVGADEILAELAAAGSLVRPGPAAGPGGAGPAEVYRWGDGVGTVGVIPALSNCFCGDCNRLRLTATGQLEPCLAAERAIDLRGPLRAGAGDGVLKDLFRLAAAIKPAGHTMPEGTAPGKRRRMSRIGG